MCCELGTGPEALFGPYTGPVNTSVSWVASNVLTQWDTCRDLDEDQNLTTTNAPAASFSESPNKKKGSGLIPSFGVTLHQVVRASSCTPWENSWRILEGEQLMRHSVLFAFNAMSVKAGKITSCIQSACALGR